jgi:hypothetical protein
MSDLAKDGTDQALKWSGRVIAVLAAMCIIIAREGFGPAYFDAIGKALFWTDIVFVPLTSLNRDVLRLSDGKVIAVILFTCHLWLVFWSFGKLTDFSFITLTPVCFAQALVFMLIFMLIRKRHFGRWYR